MGMQHLCERNLKSFSKRQLCKVLSKRQKDLWKKDSIISEWNPLSAYFK
jgi:hypothetical protein